MIAPDPGSNPPNVHLRWRQPLMLATLVTVFAYVFGANSWVGDDAYISFRVVENLVQGYGLTYNPPERVQVFTHPLWLLLHVPAYLITGEVFYSTLALSFVTSLAALVVAVRWLRVPRAVLLLGMVLSSKAFIDYTSSGLENPLSYLLLAFFLTRLLHDLDGGRRSFTARELAWYVCLASLAFVNRIDSVLIYGPVLLWMIARSFPSIRWRALTAVALGALPALMWETFALAYYGFALPNTFYAKVATGIPESLLFRQGLVYVVNSLGYDAVTLSIIAVAAIAGLLIREPPYAAISLGLLLSVAYTVWVGGDHMAGRFFSVPFFGAALTLSSRVRRRTVIAAGLVVLAAYNLGAPLAPLKSGPDYRQGWAWRDTNGVQDERGYYHRATNLLLYNPLRELPDHEWYRQGLSFARGPDQVSVQGSIGFFGYRAGPHKFLIDPNALADPLLARLPVSDQLYFEFYVGHYRRDLPEGYLESCLQGRNRLADPALREFYDHLRNVTRGPLFSLSRVRDIWHFNVGRYRTFAREFDRRRIMRVSVPAANDRLRTDTGERDLERLELRTRGQRAGYLQYGGNVPMRPGRYRARWVGRYDGTPPFADTGIAEVWVDGRRIGEANVRASDAGGTDRKLAQLEFDIERYTVDAELRLFLHAGVAATLERLEVIGAPAATANPSASADLVDRDRVVPKHDFEQVMTPLDVG
jgi:arabinofuranosyltransferase